VFFTCLWEKNSTEERLVVMARALVRAKVKIGTPILDINSILEMYNRFEELPNTINVCLEDLFVDAVGTFEKIWKLLASNCPGIHIPGDLANEMLQACDAGKCNSFAQQLDNLNWNKAFKCCLHDTEELCGSFEGEPVHEAKNVGALLSWCLRTNPEKCKWVATAAAIADYPVGVYAYAPVSTTSERKCYPNIWEVQCDLGRTFVPATLEDLHNALRTLDPQTLTRVTEVSESMNCRRDK